MPKTRNLVIGCDGTWNDTESGAITNVAKILNACLSRNQEIHYEEGVGTAHWEALPGGIYGKGLDRQILGAYRFLRRRFADKDWEKSQNKVFIFGFSRGAYAARRLAGLISHSGIPVKAQDVELGWQIYLKRDVESAQQLKDQGNFFNIDIEVLGIWDTVKTTTDPDFNDHKLPDCVLSGYHAIAIDEKRNFFPVVRWDKDSRVTQYWFSGVHSDVGGGYNESGLSNGALKWMIDKAYVHGLRFKKRSVEKLNIDAVGTLHDSYVGIWRAFGAKKRNIAANAIIHASVKERMEKLSDYKPENLPENPNFQS